MKITTVILTLLLVLCNTNVLAETDSSNASETKQSMTQSVDFSLKTKWETSGFSMPESVFSSAAHPWLYVSNVNGSAPGFISRVAKNGTIENLKWVTGLITPTGSDMYQDTLYVADAKKLRLINVNTGKVVDSIDAPSAVSLNDVSVDQATGNVYISDVLGGKIYLFKDNKLSTWFESDKIPFPNGVLVQGNSLIVANYALKNGEGLMRKKWLAKDFGSLFDINLKTKTLRSIESSHKKGIYDGVINFNGVLIASSNPTGQVISFSKNKSHLLESTEKGVADINTDGTTIYSPYLFDNKLVAFEPVAWDKVTSKNEYLAKAANRFYGEAGGMSVATEDGQIMGNFAGQALKGTWQWKDSYFCRTSTLGTMDLGYDCIVIEVTPSKMRLTLNKGNGMQVVYSHMTEAMIQTQDEINIFTTFDIKPDMLNDYVVGMNENVDLVRQESGNAQMRFFQSSSTPTNLFLIGRNKDKAQLAAHTKAIEKRGVEQKLAPTIASAPTVRFLTPVHSLNGHYSKYLSPSKRPYVVFSLVEVKPEFEADYLQEMKRQVTLSRKEKDNLLFDFYRVNQDKIKDKNTYFVHGEWRNKAAFEHHIAEKHTQHIGDLFGKYLVGGKSSNQLYKVNELNREKN